MTKKVYFQNSTNGSPSYTAKEFTSVLGSFITDGVFVVDGTAGLAVSFAPTSSKDAVSVSIAPGKACIDGQVLVVDAVEQLDIGPATGAVQKFKVQVYTDTSTGEMSIEAIEEDIEAEAETTKKITPLALVTVNPKSSKKIDSVKDERVFVENIMNHANLNTFIQPLIDGYEQVQAGYEAIASGASGSGVQTLGVQTITGLQAGTHTYTPPTGCALAFVEYEVFLNGRQYNGDLISVNTHTSTITISTEVAGENSATVVLYYPQKQEQVVTE